MGSAAAPEWTGIDKVDRGYFPQDDQREFMSAFCGRGRREIKMGELFDNADIGTGNHLMTLPSVMNAVLLGRLGGDGIFFILLSISLSILHALEGDCLIFWIRSGG